MNPSRHRTASCGRPKTAVSDLFLNIIGVVTVALAATESWAQDSAPARHEAAQSPQPAIETARLNQLSLEELLNIEVTSAAKKPEKLSETAAAIYVITEDDIRRSGVTSIAEALRMAPGMDVARLDAHTWTISSRGFNDIFADKLLVLMDGRSVYTPLFSGVYWDVQDTLLQDIDRIEVIRGPGGSLWGANAVNGVINIITKNAKDTQGVLLYGGGGTEERGFGGFRYGGKLGEDVYFRIYGKYFDRDNQLLANGLDGNDGWWQERAGIRMDWNRPDSLVTLQGDLYYGRQKETFGMPSLAPPFSLVASDKPKVAGGNVLGRWTYTFANESQMTLQTYYDRTVRETSTFEEDRNTFDVDLQHRFKWGERQEIVCGLGYHWTGDQIRNGFDISFDPDQRDTNLLSAFLQDEIVLVKNRLRLTVGSKVEHNDFTGYEVQPSARLLWTPQEQHTVWAAVSRAIREPSRAEDDVRINQQVLPPDALGPGSPLGVVSLFGNDRFESEKLLAYELGYRFQPVKQVSLDFSTFYNVYDNLLSFDPQPSQVFSETSPSPPHLVIPVFVGNNLKGETYGCELAAKWQVTNWCRAQASYSFLEVQLHRKSGSTDTTNEAKESASPTNQFSVRCSMDLPANVQFDCGLRYVDNLPALQIPSYLVADVRLAWKPTTNWELSVVGQNLLDDRHPEFRSNLSSVQPTEVEHSVYGMVTWRF
ncbi:MAG: iron complex outerrane recepter protein [Chthoniobacter sp.]|nr:iron complex outerrane recepter protein [Chthoniobacter sp.]